ncbi:MAG: glycosyltransferase family 39 protein [Acidobacteriota bacterium]|nr:glycosyltransferase family 39 protein [Acidobacteriota bacterium]
MSGRLRLIVTAGAIAGITLILYGTRLGPPPPLSSDEAALYAHAQSLASSGRDTAGRIAPLFFQTSEEAWLQPIPVYSTAAVLAVTSTAEWGARFSTARVAALSALLIYLIGRRLFRRESLAISCSALLALTPALFAHARIAGDGPYPLPFVLVWLYCLLAFRDRPRTWLLVIAGVALGLGVYSQPGAPITMAFLAVITVPALRASGHLTLRTLMGFAAGFVLPLLVMVPWFISHPETYRDTMGRWAILQAHIRFPLDGLRAFVNWTTLGMRASFYWGFFDPSWLFFSGADRAGVLRGAAPLLWPLAVLVPLGFSLIVKVSESATRILLTGGLLIAPMAAATLGVPHNIGQAMTVIPFAVLLAGFGILRVLSATSPVWRTIGLAVIALVPIQFAYFYVRYFS